MEGDQIDSSSKPHLNYTIGYFPDKTNQEKLEPEIEKHDEINN